MLATQMALIRKIFWLALFLISTLGFVVLFEKGAANFVPNFQSQIKDLTQVVREQFSAAKKTDKP